MVCHVGYFADVDDLGRVSIYDTDTTETNSFFVVDVDFDEINFKLEPIFKEILAELKGKELGNFCTAVLNCPNDARKKLIECGLKSGFKNVSVIDATTAFFLFLALQTEYIPKNGDVIWIVTEEICFIWKKENDITKIVDHYFISNKINFSKHCCEKNWKPNAMFVTCGPSKFDVRKAIEMFPSCFFEQLFFNDMSYGAMIKSRIVARDPAVTDWNAKNVLQTEIDISQKREKILTIELMQPLPIIKTFKLKNATDTIFVHPAGMLKEEIANPGSILCKINIDENGIFEILKLEDDEIHLNQDIDSDPRVILKNAFANLTAHKLFRRFVNYDVILISASGTEIPSLLVILAQASTYFLNLYKQVKERPIKVVQIPDFDTETITAALYFCCYGMKNAIKPKEIQVFQFATKYSFPSLIEACSIHFEANLSPSNVCKVIELAYVSKVESLKQKCHKMLVENKNEINPNDLKNLSPEIRFEYLIFSHPAEIFILSIDPSYFFP